MPTSSSVPITLPPRVKPGDAVTAAAFNSIRDALQRLTMRGGMKPHNFGASSIELPFTVTMEMDGETVNLSVLGGAWQEGATGEWEIVDPTPADEGVFAYLVIEQDADRAITSVSVSIEAEALDPVVIVPADDPTPETATSNVLLAELDEEGELVQRRHGNFTLGVWQIDGDVVRWPETVIGTIPTPPEEETPP